MTGLTYSLDLTVVWAVIIAFGIFAYVVMDGFDLGIGILFPGFEVGAERDAAMNSIAPVWDGNETWLVLGGGGLFAAFPLAYAIILPATYPLVIAMLLGLVFRGVAFEFRWRDPVHRRWWDRAFTLGSLVAAIAQGMMLGAILQGIRVVGRAFSGGWLDWLTPFTVLTGISVAVGYALLGATWLIGKTDGPAQAHARRMSASFRITALVSANAPIRIATSTASPARSITRSSSVSETSSCGNRSVSSPRTGATCRRPNETGAVTLRSPTGSSRPVASVSSPWRSASNARSTSIRSLAPSSVGDRLRVVRLTSLAPTLPSNVSNLLLTTARLTFISRAAADSEPDASTFWKVLSSFRSLSIIINSRTTHLQST